MTPEDVIRRYVEATSAADGDAAAALTADDVVIELPSGRVLRGKDGAREFAAKHAEGGPSALPRERRSHGRLKRERRDRQHDRKDR
jgi:hypothetical protein